MRLEKWIKDSFLFGLLFGIVSIVFFFYLVSFIRSAVIYKTFNQLFLRPPAVQMIATALNIIVFRILMINLHKEKTGRGFLFITVIIFLSYFFYYSKLHR
jgi:hypothetical protein